MDWPKLRASQLQNFHLSTEILCNFNVSTRSWSSDKFSCLMRCHWPLTRNFSQSISDLKFKFNKKMMDWIRLWPRITQIFFLFTVMLTTGFAFGSRGSLQSCLSGTGNRKQWTSSFSHQSYDKWDRSTEDQSRCTIIEAGAGETGIYWLGKWSQKLMRTFSIEIQLRNLRNFNKLTTISSI